MKRLLSVIICAMLAVLSLTACGDNAEKGHSFMVVDKAGRENITATFKNADTGETLEVDLLQQTSVEAEFAVYGCHADTALYDRVIITSDKTVTEELAFNDYVNGWDLSSGRAYPYTIPPLIGDPQTERVTFDYEDRTKDILIWTPDDYDASSAEKYSVIYMTDGQNLFERAATSTGSWGVAESALAMAANSGEKCIIVGIENKDSWRDSELTPDIGVVRDESYEDGRGAYFADFVVDTVMPYVNENYNVYTDREHTHICGSSSGGIESFYIAMEHPDKFASVGAISPAFILYSDETWAEYLGAKDFSDNAPFVYLYCGNSSGDSLEQMLYLGTVSMPGSLSKIGYPEDKVVIKTYDSGIHKEKYWRAVFPDYLKYAFPSEKTE